MRRGRRGTDVSWNQWVSKQYQGSSLTDSSMLMGKLIWTGQSSNLRELQREGLPLDVKIGAVRIMKAFHSALEALIVHRLFHAPLCFALGLSVRRPGNLVNLLVFEATRSINLRLGERLKLHTLENVGCKLRYCRNSWMHLSAASTVSNLNTNT